VLATTRQSVSQIRSRYDLPRKSELWLHIIQPLFLATR
jgi:hypothetical protein